MAVLEILRGYEARVTVSAILTAVLLALLGTVAFTYIFTRLRYFYQLSQLLSSAAASQRGSPTPQRPVAAPQIPYSIPLLGHARAFLAPPKPGMFWRSLLATHPREAGACTLLLGGQTSHVVFDATAVQALFRARKPTRERLNDQVMVNALCCSRAQVDLFYGHGDAAALDARGKDVSAKRKQEKIWEDYLLRADAVNELTREFSSRLRMQFAEAGSDGKETEVGITSWLRRHMFRASIIALLGSRILDPDIYPNLVDDFWAFDQIFMRLFFGLPKIMLRNEHEILERTMDGMQKWQLEMQKETHGGNYEDPNTGPSWEPSYGSRVSRARQLHYDERGIDNYMRAAADLGFVFGLASNAIPAACWMVMHIIDPKSDGTLHKRIMEELRTVTSEDGSLDIPKLMALPLVQAIFHEILRLYTDVLVTRDLPEDLTLPFDDGRLRMAFKKGTTVMVPSYVSHHDDNTWRQSSEDAPVDTFYPDRFLRTDSETGTQIFTLTGTVGKFFPFGGGKTICPGRIFAKQEVLASVASTLLEFDIESVGYLDGTGEPTDTFPQLRDGLGGGGVVVMEGDIKVRIK